MKAWQFTGTNNPLQLNEVPEPHAGPGQVVVEVKAAGVCHSDVTALDDPGWMPLFFELPRTMGHENAGVITEVGEGMEHWKVGDRVGLAPVMSDGDALGYGKWDGGFGPKLLATDDNLVRLPDEVPFDLAAMATDAGLTAYHAIMAVGGAKAGMKVGVIGFGGLGQIGARAAVLAGAEVHVAEMKEEAWPAAKEVGAVSCVRDAAEWVDAANPRAGGDFDLIVDYAGFDTTQKAVNAVKRGGKVVQVGLGKPTFTVATNTILGKSIEGSLGGTVADIEEVFDLMLRGEIRPGYEEITFDQVGEGLERLKNNQVLGRLVARFGA